MAATKPSCNYSVVRNDNYYLGRNLPYLDKVVFKIVPDQNTILPDLQAGNTDSAYFLDVSKALVYESLSNYQVVADSKTCSFEAIYFDVQNKILANNPEVRQAIARAVDQRTLVP